MELEPNHFKRRYGVEIETFWKMVEVVRKAQEGRRGSHAKLSIPDQMSAEITVLARIQDILSYSPRLGNSWIHSASNSAENWRHPQQSSRISLARETPIATIWSWNWGNSCRGYRNRNWATKKKQKCYYSGKQKCHTFKVQLIINQPDKSVICTEFGKGRQHDFRIFKNSKLKVLQTIEVLADKGYQGINRYHSNSYIPHKKPRLAKLTPE